MFFPEETHSQFPAFLSVRMHSIVRGPAVKQSSVGWKDHQLSLLRFSDSEMSSTFFHTLKKTGDMVLPKSLTIMRNKVGLSFVPWETPALTGSPSQTVRFNLTRCFLSVRKLMIQGITLRLMSFWTILEYYNKYSQKLLRSPESKLGVR